MTELLKGIFSVSLILLGMGAILVPMFFVIRHRDRTVKLPIDREKLNRLPGFGIQKQIQELQFDILSAMLMSVIVVTIPFAFEGLRGYLDKYISFGIYWIHCTRPNLFCGQNLS